MDICKIEVSDPSDPKSKAFFMEGYELCKNGKQIDVIKFIDDNRLISNYMGQIKAAFYCLAIAKYNYENQNNEESGKYFHYAGHSLKYTNYINQAARAYNYAGCVLREYFNISQDSKKLFLAVRSFAQSKNCFYEVGNSDESEKMYIEEQKTKIQLLRSQGKTGVYLRLWQYSSNFGTSLKKWFICAIIFILSFSCIYEYFFRYKDIIIKEPSKWTTGISAFYFSIVTISTLGYGEIVPINWVAQLVVIFNIAIGYVLLGLGIGIITRKIKGH